MIPQGLLYTNEHEWVKLDGAGGTVGITDHAQSALGDITFVELPVVGKTLAKGDEACVVESCKAAASVYTPADGSVTEGNAAVDEDPSLVNSDPYGQGGLYKLEFSDAGALAGLMNAEQYAQFLEEQEH